MPPWTMAGLSGPVVVEFWTTAVLIAERAEAEAEGNTTVDIPGVDDSQETFF